MSNIKAYAITSREKDTYQHIGREMKEQIGESDILQHWEIRAQRPNVQSVMSARHSLEENIQATERLQKDILDFLGDLHGKRIFEFGFGIGRMTEFLAQRAREVVGIDISPTMMSRAQKVLKNQTNIQLLLGKVTELNLPPKSFDLVFDCIVLLHILNPEELRSTIAALQNLSDSIFITEHTFEGQDSPISKYSILREPEEYQRLFEPFKLVKQKDVRCVGDRFTMMLFQK